MNVNHQLYSDIEVSSEVMGASNHKQIQLLLDKCLQQIRASKQNILAKNIKKKIRSIESAKDIVNYLRGCLNFEDEQAKDLSTLLDSVYDFLDRSLRFAALRNDVEYLDQADLVLSNIKEGWDGIAPK